MMLQISIVALVVLGSSVYAAWRLMPAALRRALARKLLELRWPERIAVRLRQHASSAADGGCDGCARSPAATRQRPPAAGAPITFHPRPPR